MHWNEIDAQKPGDREGEGLEYHVNEHEEEGLGFGKGWRLTANSDSELF